MKTQLIAKFNLSDVYNNKKIFKVYEVENGNISYSLTNLQGVSFSVSNLQIGYRGPNLIDNVYEVDTIEELIKHTKKALIGSVATIEDAKVFINEFKFK